MSDKQVTIDEQIALLRDMRNSIICEVDHCDASKASQTVDAILATLESVHELEADAARIQELEDRANRGQCNHLVYDDDGNWAISGESIAPLVNPSSVCVFVDPESWKPSIRAALDTLRANPKEAL